MTSVLVVDDEPGVLAAFEELLASQGHRVRVARSAEAAMELLAAAPPELVIMDICMPGLNGLEAFRRIRAVDPRLPVIIMTGQGTMDSAIEATKLGAFDYQLKPFEPEAMLQAVGSALEAVRLSRRHVELNPATAQASRDAIIGRSPGMQQLYKAIGRVAATDATVLIRGESGTGKELVARAVFQHSLRSAGPLLVVNCVAIPETLLESELFGYERGAFTGASHRRIGKFEQAHGGTVFLDEIGDIPPSVQAKLLRVLQERTFERIGGNETLQADVRVLAATNRNLEQAIAEGTFREDLYYRLNVVTLRVPALRERQEDIPLLVQYFLQRFAQELKVSQPLVADDGLELLRSHPWPGNVRQLEHCIYRAMIFTRGYPIRAADVARALEESAPETAVLVSSTQEELLLDVVRQYLDAGGEAVHERLLEKVDALLVKEALRRTGGNQTKAGQLLGLPRPTVHAKLRKHGLSAASGDAEASAS